MRRRGAGGEHMKEEFEERQEWIRRRKERLAKEKWIPGLPR